MLQSSVHMLWWPSPFLLVASRIPLRPGAGRCHAARSPHERGRRSATKLVPERGKRGEQKKEGRNNGLYATTRLYTEPLRFPPRPARVNEAPPCIVIDSEVPFCVPMTPVGREEGILVRGSCRARARKNLKGRCVEGVAARTRARAMGGGVRGATGGVAPQGGAVNENAWEWEVSPRRIALKSSPPGVAERPGLMALRRALRRHWIGPGRDAQRVPLLRGRGNSRASSRQQGPSPWGRSSILAPQRSWIRPDGAAQTKDRNSGVSAGGQDHMASEFVNLPAHPFPDKLKP